MAQITLKGNPIHSVGELPKVGAKAPEFHLTGTDLADCKLSGFAGKTVVLSIFPSCDTPVCAASIRKFNEAAGQLGETVIVNASLDLPFAHKRFCESEGLKHVRNASAFRSPNFGRDYGITITDGALAGLFGRAVLVIDPKGVVTYSELVPEIAQEPNYDAVLSAIAQHA
ncbi:MAG: thiol peroxidase [Planctomycetota bacterium]